MKTKIFLMILIVCGYKAYSQTYTYLGQNAGNGSSGGDLTAVGYKAGDVSTGSWNAFYGANAGLLNTTGGQNTFLGADGGHFNTTGSLNTFIGMMTGYKNTIGQYNTFLGSNTGKGIISGSKNTFLGCYAGNSGGAGTGTNNIFVGFNTGQQNDNSYNTFLGTESGKLATGSSNVFLGYQAGYNELGSNKLYIDNSNTVTPLIYGDFSGDKVGINSLPNTTHTLTVGGTIHSTGLYVNNILVSGDLSLWERSGTNVFTQSTADNIGIGTTLTNNPNSYKLAVNGKIGAKEVQIENTSLTWPDFVFKPDYKLMSLVEVEAFIKAYGHLPEVPSEKQVAEEGIKVSELNAKLLQKIEELTLYVIELKKEVDVLKKDKE